MTPADATPEPSAPGEATFRTRFRIRFDEAGPDGSARASTFLRLAQDLAWQHGSALGLERSWYEAHGLVWLVRAADLEVRRRILAGEELEARTLIPGYRPAWARRLVEFRSDVGERAAGDAAQRMPVAVAQTDWVLVDRRGRLVRIPPSFGERFSAPALELEPTRVRPGSVPDDAHRMVIRVRPHEVDPNGHLNNAALIDWLDEVVLAAGGTEPGAIPRRYRVEYALPLLPGIRCAVAAWRGASAWAVDVRTEDGATAARATLEAASVSG